MHTLVKVHSSSLLWDTSVVKIFLVMVTFRNGFKVFKSILLNQ